MNGYASFGPQHGSGILEKHLYTRTPINRCTYKGNTRHTDVVLGGGRSSVIVPPHFLQSSSAYTPGLGLFAVYFLCVGRNERYGRKLK